MLFGAGADAAVGAALLLALGIDKRIAVMRENVPTMMSM